MNIDLRQKHKQAWENEAEAGSGGGTVEGRQLRPRLCRGGFGVAWLHRGVGELRGAAAAVASGRPAQRLAVAAEREQNGVGAAAAAMYKNLAKALKKAYPEHAAKPRATWRVIEDNDPAGFKSSKGN